MSTITSVDVIDVRFPTSATLDGSDAMNPDGDYSAAYVVLATDDDDLAGYGLTFTIGRGNDLCVAAARQIGARLAGRDVDAMAADLRRPLPGDHGRQPDALAGAREGVVHLAAAAVLNAAWDLAARRAGKPLWRLVADMSPEEIVAACDFRYLSDVLTPAEAVEMLARLHPTREERVAELAEHGYPAYTTSPGWLGYDDDKLRRLLREGVADGWTHVKLKVGAEPRRRPAAAGDRPRGARRPPPHDRRQPGVGRAGGHHLGRTGWRPTSRCGSRSRPAPTTSWATPPSARRSRPSASRRGALPQQGDVQAAPPGGGDRLLPDRLLPPGLGERDHPHPADGRQVRRAGLPHAGESACARSSSTCR